MHLVTLSCVVAFKLEAGAVLGKEMVHTADRETILFFLTLAADI
jgi:hypothetical protein